MEMKENYDSVTNLSASPVFSLSLPESSPTSSSPRKVKRELRACVRCAEKKLGCSKKYPCSRCLKENVLCKEQQYILDVKIPAKRAYSEESSGDCSSIGVSPLSDTDASVESIVQVLYNPAEYYSLIKQLSSTTTMPTNYSPGAGINWTDTYSKFEVLFRKIDFQSSRKICLFGTIFTSFIHQGTVPQIFMEEHDQFWRINVSNDRSVLFSFKDNKFLKESPKNFYYWLALYYINISVGVLFGQQEFANLSGFCFDDNDMRLIPKLFFYMSLDCLAKAEFLVPDIRAIQVFCCMTLCLPVFFNDSYLEDSIFKVIMNAARSIDLNYKTESNRFYKDEQAFVPFEKEISKRLWQSLTVNDWMQHSEHTNKVNIKINEEPVVTALITYQQMFNHSMKTTDYINSYRPACEMKDMYPKKFSNAVYLKFMYEIAELKYSSHLKRKFRDLNKNFLRLTKNLQERFNEVYKEIKYFQNEIDLNTEDFSNIDRFNSSYSKFLLFVNLLEQSIATGNMLMIVGKESWGKKFRSKCLGYAIEILQSVDFNVPRYYFIHYSVSQSLIYASLCLLFDMLSYHDSIDNKNEKDVQFKLNAIERAFPILESLDQHLSVKVSLPILKKLYDLVKTIKTQPNGALLKQKQNELIDFLGELKSTVNSLNGTVHGIPSFRSLQYCRNDYVVHPDTDTEIFHFDEDYSTDPREDEILNNDGQDEAGTHPFDNEFVTQLINNFDLQFPLPETTHEQSTNEEGNNFYEFLESL